MGKAITIILGKVQPGLFQQTQWLFSTTSPCKLTTNDMFQECAFVRKRRTSRDNTTRHDNCIWLSQLTCWSYVVDRSTYWHMSYDRWKYYYIRVQKCPLHRESNSARKSFQIFCSTPVCRWAYVHLFGFFARPSLSCKVVLSSYSSRNALGFDKAWISCLRQSQAKAQSAYRFGECNPSSTNNSRTFVRRFGGPPTGTSEVTVNLEVSLDERLLRNDFSFWPMLWVTLTE